MKTSTVILLAAAGIGGAYLLSRMFSTNSGSALAAAQRARQPSSPSAATIGSAIGGLINGLFTSHDAGSANSAITGLSGNAGAYDSAGAQASIAGLQSSDAITTTNGFIFTDASGDFIAG